MNQPTPIEEMEQAVYEALLAEFPDMQPLVARGLAKTAAERIRERRNTNEKSTPGQQISHRESQQSLEDKHHENNEQQPSE
jgi:hypothetical protein